MRKLELKFKNEEDKMVTYSLEKPVDDIDPNVVKEAMEEILEQNIFETSGGELVSIETAQYVDHDVTEIDLD